MASLDVLGTVAVVVVNPTVVIDGCDTGVVDFVLESGGSVSDAVDACALSVPSHGDFVSCVSDLANTLRKARLITNRQKSAMETCASQANIPPR